MAIMRLAYPGSLVGFDSTRSKIWDSHVDYGRYTDLALSLFAAAAGGGGGGGGSTTGTTATAITTATTAPSAGKVDNSTLEISDSGVRIYGTGEDGVVVVTWRIVAPGAEPGEEDGSSGTPTAGPTAGTTTTSPTTAVSSFFGRRTGRGVGGEGPFCFYFVRGCWRYLNPGSPLVFFSFFCLPSFPRTHRPKQSPAAREKIHDLAHPLFVGSK